MFSAFLALTVTTCIALANPSQDILSTVFHSRKPSRNSYDIQAHRGGRANTVENSLPSFAWGLIEGSTTLEMDNGVTRDGIVVVWHDYQIISSKCLDTGPAFPSDVMYPYVGKFIANLTLAQIKTLDCGSQRLHEFPHQLIYPGTRIPTLQEVFDFLDCADPDHHILMNIESKINPVQPNETLSVNEFVNKQHSLFANSPYYHSITYQSFDWRTLIEMKRLDPTISTSALIDDATAHVPEGSITSPWLGGVDMSQFNGSTLGERAAQAAHAIGADVLSPVATAQDSTAADPALPGYRTFTTAPMVSMAHALGTLVKPWTVNRLNIADQLLDFGVDGIITDVPEVLRRWAQQKKLPVAPRYPKYHVLACLARHNK